MRKRWIQLKIRLILNSEKRLWLWKVFQKLSKRKILRHRLE
nr:MAG TPA: hypothetical protein [Caudoviricetes sp.]